MSSILVVDDSHGTRTVVREILEAAGHTVADATNGADAITVLVSDVQFTPALIILNLEMPKMTGWEFARIIRSYHRLASIPLLVISANDPSALGTTVIDGFLQKPFAREQLLAEVERCIAGKP